MTFENYWEEHGIRLLNDDNSIPSIEERCRHAFESGRYIGIYEGRSMEFLEIKGDQ